MESVLLITLSQDQSLLRRLTDLSYDAYLVDLVDSSDLSFETKFVYHLL